VNDNNGGELNWGLSNEVDKGLEEIKFVEVWSNGVQ
jgi:hypothetical protein